MANANAPAADPTAVTAHPHPTERAQLARRAAFSALLLGILGDTLFRANAPGLNMAAWASAVGAALLALAWRRDERLSRESALWLVTAIVLAAGFVWRDAELLLFFDLLGVIASLMLLSMSLRGAPATGLLTARLRDLVYAAFVDVASAATRAPLLVARDTEPRIFQAEASRGRLGAGARAVALAIPLLLVFTPLLVKADPVFGSIFTLPALDFGTIVSHVIVTGFFAWIVGGWMRGALLEAPRATPGGGQRVITLGALDVTTTLGLLDLLFAAFVVVQLGWLFGGAALVQRTTGLSYAEYARRGFFELTWVALLTAPVLLGVRAAIPDDDAKALRRYRIFAAVCLGLLGAIIVSAAARMQLYVRFYGLSTDRIYASAIMLWITLSLAALGATVVRGRPRRFAAAVVGSALAVLAGLNAIDPAGLVVRSQVERSAADPGSLDAWYLSRLGADAAPELVAALLAQPLLTQPEHAATQEGGRDRCRALALLLRRYGSDRNAAGEPAMRRDDWRSWNAARANAVAVVQRNEPALRALQCWNTKTMRTEPFGAREFANDY